MKHPNDIFSVQGIIVAFFIHGKPVRVQTELWPNHEKWSCSIKTESGSFKFPFWAPFDSAVDPKCWVYCIFNDAVAGMLSIGDFCGEFFFDDYRAAGKAHRSCMKARAALNSLGFDDKMIVDALNNEFDNL